MTAQKSPADLQAEMSECARKFSEWQRRYPLEVEADPEITDVPTFNLHGTQDTHDFRDYGLHELKRGEGPYMNVETQPGDLDIFSRPLRPGS